LFDAEEGDADSDAFDGCSWVGGGLAWGLDGGWRWEKLTRKHADNTLVVFGCKVASLCQDEELHGKEAVSPDLLVIKHVD